MVLEVRPMAEDDGANDNDIQGAILHKHEIKIPAAARPAHSGEGSEHSTRRLEVIFELDLQGMVQLRETIVVQESPAASSTDKVKTEGGDAEAEENTNKDCDKEGNEKELPKQDEPVGEETAQKEKGDAAKQQGEAGESPSTDKEGDNQEDATGECDIETAGDIGLNEKDAKQKDGEETSALQDNPKVAADDQSDNEKDEENPPPEASLPLAPIRPPATDRQTEALAAVPMDGCVAAGMGTKRVRELVLAESKMAKQDQTLRETAEKRNSLEAFVYAMRDSLSSSASTSFGKFVSNAERVQVLTALQEAEDWLYDCSDGGGDDSAQALNAAVFVKRLQKLEAHTVLLKVEKRQRVVIDREEAVGALQALIKVSRQTIEFESLLNKY